MGMNVRQDSFEGLLAGLASVKEEISNAIVGVFASIGDYVIKGIRNGELGNWNNQTGSLRSSVGFAVCRNGGIVRMSGFETILDGSEGSAKGRALCERLASEYAKYPYALFVVAGEDYAAYVEAVESKVVLAGGQLYIEGNIAGMLRDAIKDVLSRYEK